MNASDAGAEFHETVACPDCDLLQRIPSLAAGERALCPRCRHVVAESARDPLDLPLALTLGAAIVFVVANSTPLMGLSVLGRSASTTIAGGAWQMWQMGEPLTAIIVAGCAMVAPGVYILLMLAVLLGMRRPAVPRWAAELLRWARRMQPWAMNEVMMLGILVALIKISESASVEPGVGMFAVGALVVLLPAIMVAFDPRELWRRIEWAAETGDA